jgi:hypothetical protein
MKRIMEKSDTGLSGRGSISSRLSRAVLTTLALASLLFGATSAKAACGMSGLPSGTAIKLPFLAQAGSDANSEWQGNTPSIVGLWGVVYTAGGMPFNVTFDQWHSDGTEFETAYLPVATGNLCVGVWKAIGPRTVKLHHIGWTFDPVAGGNANGTFTLDETITLSNDGKAYTGSFTFRAFDIKGNQQAEIPGTILAQRITVD